MLKVQLIVVAGKPEGKAIPLVASVFRIGRDPSCHLRPSSDQVSRQHAEIQVGDDFVQVKDLGSRNGTQLNGRSITAPTNLKSGDLVKVGPLTFAVSIQGAPAAYAGADRPQGTRSLDEVDQSQVESWLIADQERPIPDRPSGVYDGETITIEAYKSGSRTDIPTSVSQPPAAKPAPKPKPAFPQPSPPAAQQAPATPPAAPAPPPAPPAAPAPVAQTAPPVAAPAPAPEAVPPAEGRSAQDIEFDALPTPVPERKSMTRPAAARRSFLEELEDFEVLPEGEGDGPGENASASGASGSANSDTEEQEDSTDEVPTPDEFMDESNPFYIAKKQAGSGEVQAATAKESFKDSSDAANAILKKMLDRRKNR